MKIQISNYQDFLNYTNAQANAQANAQVELPEVDETICQVCGATLKSTMENLGFDDNPYYEVDYFCPNGCEQDDSVIIL